MPIGLPDGWTAERFIEFSESVQSHVNTLVSLFDKVANPDGSYTHEWLFNFVRKGNHEIGIKLYRECRELEQFLVCNDRGLAVSIYLDPEGYFHTNAHMKAIRFASPVYVGIFNMLARGGSPGKWVELLTHEKISEVVSIVRREYLICLGSAGIADPGNNVSAYFSPTNWRKMFKASGTEMSARSFTRFKKDAHGESHPSSGDRLVRFPVIDLKMAGFDLNSHDVL